MSDLTPDDFARLPEQYQYVRDHIDQPRMQAIVAMGALGGLGVGKMIFDAYRDPAGKTEEEAEADVNALKFVAGALLAGGLFYAFDIDRKWWGIETASVEAEQWLKDNATNYF